MRKQWAGFRNAFVPSSQAAQQPGDTAGEHHCHTGERDRPPKAVPVLRPAKRQSAREISRPFRDGGTYPGDHQQQNPFPATLTVALQICPKS